MSPACTRGEPLWAYFDVDGTLINTRSLLGFLEHFRKGAWVAADRFQCHWRSLAERLASAAPREDLNRQYYAIFEGLTPELIAELGRQWVTQASLEPGFWRDDSVARLQRHRLMGTRICLVTGSFRGVIGPLAELLGAHEVLCSEPEVVGGRYTGRLSGAPCIGQGKAEAVRGHAERHGIDLSRCVAYGDDETDQPMLALVGSGMLLTPSQAYGQEVARAFKPVASARTQEVVK